MLKEFLQQQKETPVPEKLDEEKYAELTADVFDNLVNFLRDQNKFPNPRINEAVSLMWRLIGNNEIPATLDLEARIPAAAFMVVSKDDKLIPMVILPINFVDQVRNNPEAQLGVVAYLASQCRDYYSDHIDGNNELEVEHRALAFEAETLLTLKQMASQENLDLDFIPFQRTVLEKLPEGLKSMPPEMDYATPPYPRNRDTGYRYN